MTPSTVTAALERLLAHQDLSRAQAAAVLASIFAGEANDAQIAALLTALAMKGETVDEITGFALAMRDALPHLGLDNMGKLVDTCGTGGNPRPTFNVSTAAAFVVAGACQRVAKHGNRTSTSLSGSADVVEALGVNLAFPVDRLTDCLREVGVAFFYAPLLHASMRHVMPVRRALKIRTIFNLLGPLTNPAGAQAQVIGVFADEAIPKMAGALLELRTHHSFVVRSQDGLGELSTTAVNHVAEVANGKITNFTLDARDLGLPRARLSALTGGDAAANAAIIRALLGRQPGPKRDIVLLNAAAALVAGGKARSLPEGLTQAAQAIDSGAALAKLEALVAFTRQTATATVGG